MSEYVKSDVTGKKYLPSQVVRILNIQQIIAYLNNGAELLDIYPSIDHVTDRPLLVCIFNRAATKELYDRWCNHEL